MHEPGSILGDGIARQSMIARGMRLVWAVLSVASLVVLTVSAVSTGLRGDIIAIPEVVSGVTMTNPRFTGSDDERGRYVLRADAAKARADDVIDLTRPVLEDFRGHMVTAKTGIYHRGQSLLMLQGEVSYVLRDHQEPLLTCTSVRMDLRRRRMTGKDIAVSTSGTQVKADSFYSEGDYDLVRLFGAVRTVIDRPPQLVIGE